MKTWRIASLALASFLALACAWYVNGWDYESAYSRGLLDGARVGFVKGQQNALEDLQRGRTLEPTVEVSGPA